MDPLIAKNTRDSPDTAIAKVAKTAWEVPKFKSSGDMGAATVRCRYHGDRPATRMDQQSHMVWLQIITVLHHAYPF